MGRSLRMAVAGLALASGVHVQASEQLMERSGCIACHRVDQKLIGPAFKEVAARYRGDSEAVSYLMRKIREGGEGVWGDVPMQPNGTEKITDADLRLVVDWLLKL